MILLTRGSLYTTVGFWFWQDLSIGNVIRVLSLTLCDCRLGGLDRPATPCSLRCPGDIDGLGDSTSARSTCYYWTSYTKPTLSLLRLSCALGDSLFVGFSLMVALGKGGFFILRTVNDDTSGLASKSGSGEAWYSG